MALESTDGYYVLSLESFYRSFKDRSIAVISVGSQCGDEVQWYWWEFGLL